MSITNHMRAPSPILLPSLSHEWMLDPSILVAHMPFLIHTGLVMTYLGFVSSSPHGFQPSSHNICITPALGDMSHVKKWWYLISDSADRFVWEYHSFNGFNGWIAPSFMASSPHTMEWEIKRIPFGNCVKNTWLNGIIEIFTELDCSYKKIH